MNATVAVLVPVLRRPHRVEPLLTSLAEATAEPYRVVFLGDPSDDAMRDAVLAAVRAGEMTERGLCAAEWHAPGGNYASKINHGVSLTREPLIFTAADDLHFHPGWLEACRDQLAPGIGVVGTNDLCNARTMDGSHSTHSLVTRTYCELGTIDEPGKLLHEGYPHEFVDDELVATARYRGAYAHALDAVVEHLHPQAGKAPMDDLYAAQRTRMRVGRLIFRGREHLWT